MRKNFIGRRFKKNVFFFKFRFTLENLDLGTVILSITRSFEKQSYLDEVK